MWNILKVVSKGQYNYAVVPEHPKANKHGYVLEHRVVAENVLGRELKPNEIVHHINGDKKNNNPSNLRVMDSKEHNRMHSTLGRTKVKLTCPNCGASFVREKRNTHLCRSRKTKMTFCSRRCNGSYKKT